MSRKILLHPGAIIRVPSRCMDRFKRFLGNNRVFKFINLKLKFSISFHDELGGVGTATVISVSVTLSPIKAADIFVSHSRQEFFHSVTNTHHDFEISTVTRTASGFIERVRKEIHTLFHFFVYFFLIIHFSLIFDMGYLSI